MIYLEWGGGLGDVFHTTFSTDRYARLERLKPDEQVIVILVSHNPNAKQLFEWHRNRKQMAVKDLGYWLPQDDHKNRVLHGIPPSEPQIPANPGPLTFYPAPSDASVLAHLGKLGKYILFATAAGTEPSRDLPEEIRADALRAAISRGYKAVIVGNSYRLLGRAEHTFPRNENIVNVIDRLSVPGTVLAAQRASAVVTCHSALCILGWHLKKPAFVAYPDYVKARHFTTLDQQSFGMNRPSTVHLEFSAYRKGSVERFIEGLAP